MSHSHASPAAGAPGPACGACAAPVTAGDVLCPACGVLLAAYQAPAGAAGGESIVPVAATAPLAQSPGAGQAGETVAPSPPPRHRPRSQSPIGDALRRSREDQAAGPVDVGSEAIADELARMATNDSALAREVEAELTGAKVTFDGSSSVIETEQVDVTRTAPGAPVVSAHAPAAPAAGASVPSIEMAASRAAVASAPVTAASPSATTRPVATGFDPARVARWLPFVLIGCAVLGIGRSFAGVAALLGIVLAIGLVYLLVKAASASSRKTTTMPRDESWKARPPRPRK